MPLYGLIIGPIVITLFSWLFLVIVVVRIQPRDPGEPIPAGECVSPGCAHVYITDDDGAYGHRDTLSEPQAQPAAAYEQSSSIHGSRISTVGLGESSSIPPSDAEFGRRKNRRAGVTILTTDKLKKAAAERQP